MKYLAYILILLGAIIRVIPHPANFTPLAAIAMFGGTYLNRKLAIALPLAAMVVSDFFIGFDSWTSRAAVYGSLIVSGLIGMWIRNHKSVGTVLGGTLLGAVVFYLVTNLVVLYPPTMYSHTFVGQIQSYVNALPFFRNTLLGDLFYVSVLFGAYELAAYYSAKLLPKAKQV